MKISISDLLAAALLFAAATWAGPASARGFCNVDHAGDKEQQEVVAQAAADFYQGGKHLMGMLQAFELSDPNGLQREAEAAAGSFNSSAGRYSEAAKAFSEDNELKDIDDQIVERMSQPNNPAILAVVSGLADSGAVALLEGCADKAGELTNAVKEFPQKAAEPKTSYFSELLGTFSEALTFGSVVSATFANAGGEEE